MSNFDAPVVEQETDDFLQAISRPTPQDANPPQAAPPAAAPAPQPAPSDDDDMNELEDPELLADLAVEVVDLIVVMVATGIAGEHRPEFEVSEYKRKKIKKPAAILLARLGAKVDPWVVLLIAFLAVYGPVVYQAIQIKNEKKKRAAQLKAQQDKIEKTMIPQRPPVPEPIILPGKNKGGRPRGTTKEVLMERKKGGK